MNCQKLGAKAGDLGACPAHRGPDIVQFEIEKNLLAAFYQIPGEGQTSAISEFQSDFVEANTIPDRCDQLPRLVRRFEIERYDEFFAGAGPAMRDTGRYAHPR